MFNASFFRTIKKDVKLDYTFIFLLLWRFCIFIPTFLRDGEIIKWGYQSIVFFGLYLLIKNYINNKEAFKIIYKMIFLYVFLNIILMIMYPKGLFPMYGIYFLGIRTRFTEYSIALIYISFMYYNNFSNKDKKNKNVLIISIILALINVFMKWIATGIITIILIFLIYVCIRKIKKINFIYIIDFILLIIVSINLINGNLLNLFSGIFEILHKDITLTGRTIIWDNAILMAEKYFWSGYGYINDGNIITYSNGLWQAHNTILQSICESGIIGTIIFFLMLFKLGYPSCQKCNKKNSVLNISVIFGFLIMMMAEILYYYPIFMFVIFLIGNSKMVVLKEKDDKRKK